MINEDQVEQLAIEWFKELGYEYLNGYEISPDSDTPERKNYQEVLLPKRLHVALLKLNPTLPSSAIDEAIHILQKPQHTSLIQNNRAFQKQLIEGISVDVKVDGETKEEVVVIDELSYPIFDSVDSMDDKLKESLQIIAKPVTDTTRFSKPELKMIVKNLCAEKYLTLAVLAKLLNRTEDYIRKDILNPMVGKEELLRAFPKTPNDPRQAYTSTKL